MYRIGRKLYLTYMDTDRDPSMYRIGRKLYLTYMDTERDCANGTRTLSIP